MDQLAKLIPESLISIIGLAVILVILIMLGTVAQEWGKQLYRFIRGNKEKRQENRASFNGFERRAENQGIEAAMTELIQALSMEHREMAEFINSWKEYKVKTMDDLDEIKRKQDKNWKRLFDEELPNVRHS